MSKYVLGVDADIEAERSPIEIIAVTQDSRDIPTFLRGRTQQ